MIFHDGSNFPKPKRQACIILSEWVRFPSQTPVTGNVSGRSVTVTAGDMTLENVYLGLCLSFTVPRLIWKWRILTFKGDINYNAIVIRWWLLGKLGELERIQRRHFLNTFIVFMFSLYFIVHCSGRWAGSKSKSNINKHNERVKVRVHTGHLGF